MQHSWRRTDWRDIQIALTICCRSARSCRVNGRVPVRGQGRMGDGRGRAIRAGKEGKGTKRTNRLVELATNSYDSKRGATILAGSH